MLTGGVDPSSREVNRSLITPGILIVQWHRCTPLEPSSMNFHSTLDCKSSQAHGKTKTSFPVMDSSSEYPPFKFYSTTACTEDIKVARDAANGFILHLLSGHVWVGGWAWHTLAPMDIPERNPPPLTDAMTPSRSGTCRVIRRYKTRDHN